MDVRSGCTCAEAADTLTRLTAEVERLQAIITAADCGSPIYKAVERVLDEKSAWISRPNHEVTSAVALSAGIAWSIYYPLELVDQNLSLQLDNLRLTARVKELEAPLQAIFDLPGELNPSNYDHDDVCACNAALCEAFTIARAALSPAPTGGQ